MAEGLPLLEQAELNSADPCGSAHLMEHPPNFHSWAIVTATDPHGSRGVQAAAFYLCDSDSDFRAGADDS